MRFITAYFKIPEIDKYSEEEFEHLVRQAKLRRGDAVWVIPMGVGLLAVGAWIGVSVLLTMGIATAAEWRGWLRDFRGRAGRVGAGERVSGGAGVHRHGGGDAVDAAGAVDPAAGQQGGVPVLRVLAGGAAGEARDGRLSGVPGKRVFLHEQPVDGG